MKKRQQLVSGVSTDRGQHEQSQSQSQSAQLKELRPFKELRPMQYNIRYQPRDVGTVTVYDPTVLRSYKKPKAWNSDRYT